MTIIAAAYDSPTSYAIAADSYSSVNALRIPTPCKVVRAGAVLLGGAGAGSETGAGRAWLVGEGAELAQADVRAALRAMRLHILATTERVGDHKGLDSHFLCVHPGGVLVMGHDGHITEAPHRWAVGCGEDVGLGAMWERQGSPVEVVAVAVRAACALREGCFGAPVVLKVSE